MSWRIHFSHFLPLLGRERRHVMKFTRFEFNIHSKINHFPSPHHHLRPPLALGHVRRPRQRLQQPMATRRKEKEGCQVEVSTHLPMPTTDHLTPFNSLRRYISISIPRTCLKHIISPHRVFPTSQKKRVLPLCRGWLGLVIDIFG